MRSINFYFQVHQPFRLRNYRFFDIGKNHHYFDEHQNNGILQRIADKCYLPTNQLLLHLIQKYKGRFRVSFSISGTALEQFEKYAPRVLKSFQQLAETGCVEFLSETYSHSLAALKSPEEFTRQVMLHRKKMQDLFGITPSAFRNTELIYSNHIGSLVAGMGFKTMVTEGADHILGWRSPGLVYQNNLRPELKLLLKNYRLSDDIAFRFSQKEWAGWPLTADKYVNWLNALPGHDELVNLFMDYETFGEHQWAETGIFNFMEDLPGKVLAHSSFTFTTPSEAATLIQPVAQLDVPNPISWADMERDLSAWLGNELQDEAFNNLYLLEDKVNELEDDAIKHDWLKLQTSDNFYYMCTKYFADGDVHKYFNHYESPYEAFINYMNVLSDFEIRVNRLLDEKERIISRERALEFAQHIQAPVRQRELVG